MKYDFVKYEKYYYWFLVFFISIVVNKIMIGLHTYNFPDLCEATQAVTFGTPKWIAFQSRLMGPYIVEYISYIGSIQYCEALKIFYFVTIIIEYFILFFVLLQYTNNSYKLSLTYVIFFSFLLLGIQDRWALAWDSIDIIVFTLFAYFVFSSKSTIYFVLLFLLAITNRESALFIALYIIIDSVSFKVPFRISSISINNVKKLFIGISLLVLGIIYMKLTRDYLFIESYVELVGSDEKHRMLGNHMPIIGNIKAFFVNFTNMKFINSIFFILITIYLFINFKKFDEVQIKALYEFIFVASSIFLFGFFNQTRMYTVLVPFLVFFHLSLRNKDT